MGSITADTRRASNKALDRETVNKRIISILETADKPLTAREVSERMHSCHYIPYPVRQAVAPRLTELTDRGVVKVCGKKLDKESWRMVAAYKLVEVQDGKHLTK